VVMWVLRLGGEEMQVLVFGLMVPLLGWFLPFAAAVGLLQTRLYPGAAFVAAAGQASFL
jgi:hypothetical protein